MTAQQIAAGFREEAERLAAEATRYREVAEVLDPGVTTALAQTAKPGLVESEYVNAGLRFEPEKGS